MTFGKSVARFFMPKRRGPLGTKSLLQTLWKRHAVGCAFWAQGSIDTGPPSSKPGRRLRELNVSPKRACEYFITHPIEWSDGLTITAIPQTGRILIMRGAEELA